MSHVAWSGRSSRVAPAASEAAATGAEFALPPRQPRLALNAPRSAVAEMPAFLAALCATLALAGLLAMTLGGA